MKKKNSGMDSQQNVVGNEDRNKKTANKSIFKNSMDKIQNTK